MFPPLRHAKPSHYKYYRRVWAAAAAAAAQHSDALMSLSLWIVMTTVTNVKPDSS